MSTFPSGQNPFAEVNPYAPSQVLAQPLPTTKPIGAWRHGNQMVVHRHWSLPPFCVRTNAPAETSVQRTVSWLHPLVYIALISPLIFVILALVLRKAMRLDVPLSHDAHQLLRRRLIIGYCFTGGGILLCAFAVVMGSSVEGEASLAFIAMGILGLLTLLGGILAASHTYNFLSASKIDGDYAWIRGVCPSYLERLPPWPY